MKTKIKKIKKLAKQPLFTLAEFSELCEIFNLEPKTNKLVGSN